MGEENSIGGWEEQTLEQKSEESVIQSESQENQSSRPVSPEVSVQNIEQKSPEFISTQTEAQNNLNNVSAQNSIPTKWNWGGLSLGFEMAIAHRAYLGLLILLTVIPFIGWIFGIVWAIITGLNIEKWALENPKNHYRDEEEFRKIMDGWNRAGLIVFIIAAAAIVLWILILVLIGITALFSNVYY